MNIGRGELRAQLVRLIIDSDDSDISATDLAAVNGELGPLGYTSLSYIRLIDAIENEFGVYIDPDADAESFATVDGIMNLISESPEDAHV